MEYSVGDIIKLKNNAGVLEVELSRKIEGMNGIRGLDSEMYFEDTMRLECYNYGEEYIVLMRGTDDAANNGKMEVMIINALRTSVRYFVGYVHEHEEEDVFELMK